MKEAHRAAREELALKRIAKAVKENVGDEEASQINALTGPARYPEVNALLLLEKVADILEGAFVVQEEPAKTQSKPRKKSA